MKDIIQVELSARRADLAACRTNMLVLGLFAGRKTLDAAASGVDRRLDGAIKRLMELGDFEGKCGSTAVLYGNGRIGAERVLLVGLGDQKQATLDTVRRSAAAAARKAVDMKVKKVSFAGHCAFGKRLDAIDVGRAAAEGIYFGSYRYDEFVTRNENHRPDRLRVELVDPDSAVARSLNRGLVAGRVLGAAQSYARTLANRPGNVINPPALATEAKKLARTLRNVTCTVLDERQMAAKGMGGVLAVGGGSNSKPRFIVMRYRSRAAAARRKPTVALVGKAITFDSGGINIKPSRGLDEMKLDKSGGIAVLATVKAAAEMELPLDIYGIVPAAENLPSGTSYRPGDIVTTFSGKTVEVQNTDAEGRMILCDGLSYAVRQNCEIIIDIATLTGACRVALGRYMAALMGNDDGLIKQLQQAAGASGEKVWHMPSGEEYAEEMKSKLADLKNIGSKAGYGGACTAAAFLGQFVDDKKWAHLDIASVEIQDKGDEFAAEGATGFGVRLLSTYLMNVAGRK